MPCLRFFFAIIQNPTWRFISCAFVGNNSKSHSKIHISDHLCHTHCFLHHFMHVCIYNLNINMYIWAKFWKLTLIVYFIWQNHVYFLNLSSIMLSSFRNKFQIKHVSENFLFETTYKMISDTSGQHIFHRKSKRFGSWSPTASWKFSWRTKGYSLPITTIPPTWTRMDNKRYKWFRYLELLKEEYSSVTGGH